MRAKRLMERWPGGDGGLGRRLQLRGGGKVQAASLPRAPRRGCRLGGATAGGSAPAAWSRPLAGTSPHAWAMFTGVV